MILIDEHDGRLEGYVELYALGGVGYVRRVVFDEPARGNALMLAAATALRASGVREWQLDVSPDQRAAIGVYEELGMTAEHRSAAIDVPWSRVDGIAGSEATELPVSDAEHEDLERELGMLSGHVRMAMRHSALQRQLRDPAGAPVGFVAFTPPGHATMFRVRDRRYTRPLLETIRPHAAGPTVTLLIDEIGPRPEWSLASFLLAHGGHLRRELLHFRGRIPDPTTPATTR